MGVTTCQIPTSRRNNITNNMPNNREDDIKVKNKKLNNNSYQNIKHKTGGNIISSNQIKEIKQEEVSIDKLSKKENKNLNNENNKKNQKENEECKIMHKNYLKKYEEKIERLKKENEELKEKINLLNKYKVKAEKLEKENEEYKIKDKNELKKYEEEIEKKKKENEELKEKINLLNKYKEKAEKLEKENEEYKIMHKNDLKKYEEEIEKMKKENEELKEKINLLNKYKVKAEKLEKENEEYKIMHKNDLKKYEEEIEKKKKENEEKYKILMNDNKEIIEKLGKENEELKNNYFSKEKEYENIKQNYFILQKNNEDLESKIKEIKEKEFQLEKNNNVLQNQNKEIIEKYNLLEKEYNKIYEDNLLLKKIPILVGLNNIGATCYMNATLQCLSNTDELTNHFLNKFKYDENDNNKIISNAYYNVIKNLWNRENNNKSFSPNEFKEKLSKENPLFAGIAANDSKDLINFLLERFHNELNKTKKENNYMSKEIDIYDQLNELKMLNVFTNEFRIKYNSIISNLFYGTLETKTQCQKCKNIKYNFQIFSFIEFPLEKVNQYCFDSGKRNNYSMFNNRNPDIDLYECFEYYNNLELMTGGNQMYCNICNCSYDSLYGTILYSTPNYLIINLNRGRGAVYECNVNFPEQLNLFNYVSFKMGNTVYELYAVICHIGPSSMSGHFVAFCKNRIDKKWYKFNDAFVTLCQNQNEYNCGMPYILFYKVLLSS